ncbi:MAG: ABC transporter substrate-binding protein [Alphaproteobacteria bacterium]|nr:MAG: ABC transporter substrate-binding protein [Alphaproteobacteria bacterium]
MIRRGLAAVALAAALAGAGALGAAAEQVKIGMITTLSGGGASLGIDVRDGFKLALKLAGHRAKDVQLIVEDDQRKPDKAVQIADRMVQSDDVDILTGIIWSNLALAVVPAVTAQGRFYISPNAGPSLLAGKGCHPLYFNVAWQNDNLHEAAGAYASKAGYGKAFILAPNYPAGKDALTGFKRFFKGEIVGELYTRLGQKDYASEIAQIRASDADVVFFFLPGGMGIAFLKQYKGAGVDKPLVGPAFSFDQNILQAVGDAALGVKNTSQWNKDLDNPANRRFVEAFRAEYGRLPSLYASQGYDAANLILSALERASVEDRDAFRAALEAADFESVRGAFRFNTNHHPIQDIWVREVVKEGDIYTNRTIGKALENHADAYAAECRMP